MPQQDAMPVTDAEGSNTDAGPDAPDTIDNLSPLSPIPPAPPNGVGSVKPPPTPTLERLTTYLRCLIDLGATGTETVSSAQIEQQTSISAAQFRKDLSYFGEFGKPGVGYNVAELEGRIAQILRINRLQPILLMGAGNLGSALVGYPGLEEHKFQIVAAFDNDPRKIGKRLWGMDVQDASRMSEINGTLGAKIAILAVPAVAAQAAADLAIASGVRAILNFAPSSLKVGPQIIVRNVSFLQELAVLSYHLTETTGDAPGLLPVENNKP